MHQADWHWRRNNFRELSNLWQARFRLRDLWFQLSWHLRNRSIAMSNRVRQRSKPIRALSLLANQRASQKWISVGWGKNSFSDVNRDSFRIKMRIKVGSNVNANATEIATSEELKIFVAKLTTIFFHVSFSSQNDLQTTIIWTGYDRWWPLGIEIKPNMSINATVSNLNPDRQTKVIVQMRALIQNFEDENPDWETADDEEDTEGNDKMTQHDLILTSSSQTDCQI